jgi:hypothetical protein
MMEHTLTIRFEVHEGDVTKQLLWPLGQTTLTEVVQASFAQGGWIVAGETGGVPFAGRGEYKQQAILNYLAARLALPMERSDEEEAQP